MAMSQEERREELEGMKAHEVRTLALELGFSHKKALTKSQPELIEWILKKEYAKGGDTKKKAAKGKGKKAPSKEEKAAKRAAAGKTKKKPAKKKPEPEEDEGEEEMDEGLGAVLVQIQTTQKDIINRLDSLGSALGAQGEQLEALVEAGKVNEAYNHVMACATDAIENKGDLEAAEAEVLEFVSGEDDDDDDGDDEGNDD